MPAGFQKGNKLAGSRAGSPNKWTAEVKDVIARVFEGLDGVDGLLAWASKDDEHLSAFYTRIWIKLLPMRLNVKAQKDVVYHTVQEVNEALGQRGLSLDIIERLKKIDLRSDDVVEVQNDATDETS